jgi:hypothetical protein
MWSIGMALRVGCGAHSGAGEGDFSGALVSSDLDVALFLKASDDGWCDAAGFAVELHFDVEV